MKTSDQLSVGKVYTRRQLRHMFGIFDATVNTGVFRPRGFDSIWLFVTEHKTPDRTQYSDYLEGDTLQWDGQTSGRTDPIIVEHKQHGLELLLFYRKKKYEYLEAGFQYEGSFEYVSHTGSHPAHFILQRVPSLETFIGLDLVSLQLEEEYFEGEKARRFTNYYERDPRLRTAAISFHGTKCMVCGFDFEEIYGKRGVGYIEVHHTYPVSRLGENSKINPKTDLAVVCSNCHRMIHRRRDNVLSLEEMRKLIRR